MMKWTTEQKNAIDARQGTVLVSAAAGSGKTAVLVERIMERITDVKNRCSVDELLIVTFTRAAASQMRDRIARQLSKRIAENPTDKHLLKQQMLLPYAKICTIDSFCIDLLRENFTLAGVSPDFSVIDENENKLLKFQIASEVVEELHSEASDAFLMLSEHLISSKNKDSKIIDMIIKLYDISQSYPFPEQYLESLLADYGSGKKFKNEILSYTDDAVNYCLMQNENAIERAMQDVAVEDAYLTTLNADRKSIEFVAKQMKNSDWDTAAQAVKGISFSNLKALRGYDGVIKTQVQAIRNEYKDLLKSLPQYFIADENSCDKDIEATEPVIRALIEAVELFSKNINETKARINKYDFSDILHIVISLLTDGKNRTRLAKDISENFTEIMLDEYQDTNRAQDMLFSAISKDETNLFMVGDVKQSIYRFRQAMPEIFLERRSAMEKYSGNNYPAKIFLDRNFRSRKGVIDGINFIFNQIMSESVGDVDYNDDERLVYAAPYDEHNEADMEILIIEDARESDSDEAIAVEGRAIAKKIHSIVGNFEITDGDIKRKANYGDICILMRSVSKKGDKLAQTLAKEGIPAYSEKSNNLFDSFEVNVFMSLLQVIDNPLQDIPLVSVMLSPIFGFTPDDLAKLRIADRKSSVYACILQSDDEKCKEFLKRIKYFRSLSVTMSTEAFCRRLLDETAYATMIMSMENGENRIADIRAFQKYAKAFDANYESGFSGFVRYLEKIRNQGDNGGRKESAEQKNAVKIMTVHKSKGLEFPVCFLANCSNRFNTQASYDNLIVHPKLGIGCVMRDSEKLVQYETLSHKAVAMVTKKTDVSEEMRLLYVALTRAKEKLICTMTLSNPEKRLLELALKINQNEKIPEFAIENSSSFASWILMAVLRHPDMRKIREDLMIDVKEISSESKISVEIVHPEIENITEECSNVSIEDYDAEMIEKIKAAALYEYPFANLSGVLAKVSASELADEYNYRDFFASSKPKFLTEDKLIGAEKGTALHLFMQHADYLKASTNPENHAKQMVQNGLISVQQSESIDFTKVKRFFESGLGKRLLSSDKIYREKRFMIRLPITDLYPDISDEVRNEKILVQGVMDCAFEEDGGVVLLDYKTDRVKTEAELVSRYSEQLRMYKKAIEITMAKKVKAAYLYSFSLDREIEI